MTEDIVTRLRKRIDHSVLLTSYPPKPAPDRLFHEAADEIERLRAALEFYVCECAAEEECLSAFGSTSCGYRARAALAGEKKNG